MTEQTRPIPRPRSRRGDEDFQLPAPRPYPLAKPGRYIGVTTGVRKKNYNGRRDYLVILFTLYESAEALCDGEIVAAGVPGFFNLESGPASHYARLLQMLYPDGRLPERASDLVGKMLEVEVITIERDKDDKPLPEANHYSKVSKVVGRA